MLPREYLRENAQRLLSEMPERFGGTGLEEYAALDHERRDAVTKLEEKRRRRNELTASKGKPSPETLAEMKALKEEVHALEERAGDADRMLEAEARVLREAIPGTWLKVYRRGVDGSEVHFFQHASGAVALVKMKRKRI
jgi:seryl-tRNA synthetase